MSEKEKKAIETVAELLPKLSDLEKGIVLGTVEQMAKEKREEKSEG